MDMTTTVLEPQSHDVRSLLRPRRGGSRAWRACLFGGVAVVVAIALQLADPSAPSRFEPDLVTLLRGMAAIKTLMVGAAIALVAWRLGRPVTTRIASSYVVGAWLVSGATTMIWQLSSIVPSSAVFHLGLLTLLVAAWRDEAPLGLLSLPRGLRRPH